MKSHRPQQFVIGLPKVVGSCCGYSTTGRLKKMRKQPANLIL
ncbi:hypothetical protein BRCON_2639 [Candidatus Sumerlaea chitinivorans]|uniref:Uncharacterized protein n=1 Tax=Sumerlaea chitinivorans TaxID=2250252 RepID=A0A2Z4Y814_SUMC1|nr:hypothetical protein BRCON_2639 [Candidatus Sumerlaea chitinivorans]